MQNLFLTILFAFVFCSGSALAADIRAVHSDCFFFDKCETKYPNSVVLLGTITQGDAGQFRNAVRQGPAISTVILRSNGGNVAEAMQIGHDIRRLVLETEGPQLDYFAKSDDSLDYGGGDYPLCIENGVGVAGTKTYHKGSRYKGTECICASACFLIYVAGARRDRSYVGIHRSYLSGGATRELSLDTASQAYSKLGKPIADYLDEMGVPRRYADIMLRTSSKEIYVPKYPEIMQDFYGWVPEVEEWLIARCNTISERQLDAEERRAFSAGRLTTFHELRARREGCIQTELLEERLKRRSAFFR